ncbi:MAG: hypothetical protein AAF226_12045, partial [Verrucomicrobiota bacterium]
RILRILPLALLGLVACQGEKESTVIESKISPIDVFTVSEPHESPVQISTLFAEPTPGREVVLSGEIMGRMDPFIDGRAMVMLGDPTMITPCNRKVGDDCETPWDVCCDLPDVVKKSVATIQLVDSDGGVIKSSLRDYQGMKELDYLTVKGTIAEGSNSENLLINAESFHKAEVSPYVNAKPVGE